MDEEPTARALTRLLRGAPPLPGQPTLASAGLQVPGSLLSSFVPNDVIDLIVRQVGPRGAPASLRRRAEAFLLFSQGHSLRFYNEASLERADFGASRLQWWHRFLVRLRDLSAQHLATLRVELRALEPRLHLPRGGNAFTNEWLATQDSADHVEYYDSSLGVPNAFDGWAAELLVESQKSGTNCLQIDLLIGDEAFDSQSLCLRHPAVQGVVQALPAESMSEPAKFSCVFRQEAEQSRVTLLLYSPQLVAQTLQPRAQLFDVTAWARRFLEQSGEQVALEFGQTLQHQPVAVAQGQLFPERSVSLDPEVRAQQLASLQASALAWQYLVRSLLEIQESFRTPFHVIKLHLDPESHEPRSGQTSANLLTAERDAEMHITLGEHDFSGDHLMELGELELQADITASLQPDQEWNAVHIQFSINHFDAEHTQTSILQWPGVLRFFSRFEGLLRLPNEQVSVVSSSLPGGWSYVTVILYSPDFVLDCAQAALTLNDRLTATQELRQATAELAASQQQ